MCAAHFYFPNEQFVKNWADVSVILIPNSALPIVSEQWFMTNWVGYIYFALSFFPFQVHFTGNYSGIWLKLEQDAVYIFNTFDAYKHFLNSIFWFQIEIEIWNCFLLNFQCHSAVRTLQILELYLVWFRLNRILT